MARVSLTLPVVRPDDQLFLVLRLDDVELTEPAAGQPGEIAGTPDARITVHLQGQHLAEQAFPQESEDHQVPQAGDAVPAPPGLVRALLAGPSRLVFDLPPGTAMPFTAAGVLDALQRLPLRVSAVNRWSPSGCLGRLFAPPPPVAPPAADETAIEAPFRLILSPHDRAHWRHAAAPVVRGEWSELWHTRLGSDGRGGDPELRAIWSPDFRADLSAGLPGDPFLSSLTGNDRNQLVHLTSNHRFGGGFEPSPVDSERVMLSTLGAWLEVEGTWVPPTGLSIENWRHEATMGRDQYVRVVYRGYLFPFGHRAVLVKITERKLFYRRDARTPGHVAYLYQRRFILVRQPTRSYAPRDMPLRTVTVKTRVTPNLVFGSGGFGLGDGAFWPRIRVDGEPRDFLFHLQGIDWDGNRVEWSTPLVFVEQTVDDDADLLAQVFTEYNQTRAVEGARRWRRFAGQTVAFAPSSNPGDTGFETARMSFAGEPPSGGGAPRFRPAMARAEVDVPAVRQLLGKTVPSKIVWEPSYLAAAGNAIGNAGDVFVRLADDAAKPGLEFDTEKAGGLVAPSLAVSGLSRSLGPVGGSVDSMVGGVLDPADVFPEIKLLGGLFLSEVVRILDAAASPGSLPGLTSERVGDAIVTRYVWTVPRDDLVDGGPLFQPQPGAELNLEAVVEAPLDGSPPIFSVHGELTDFHVALEPLLVLVFESVSFDALPGKKPDVKVVLAGLEFGGLLEFVRRLQEVIPLDGFGDGPTLDVGLAPPGITVGFSFGIPDVAVGVMSIQNITLGAAVFLPFGDDKLNFRFAFCERHQPFVLTVWLFGGGGFFALEIDLDDVVLIEAAFEFGLAAAIDLGVASGKASMSAGFYMQLLAGGDFELTGYFRAYGELSVLGIISVSLEFYLALTYTSKGGGKHAGKLWGQAKVTVKIEILFFSISVSVKCERAFAGSDPKFIDMVTADDWSAYAAAYADYP